jgi:curved DNA-binding protein CbpA
MPERLPMPPEGDVSALPAWEEVLDDANYYEILGVLEIADSEAIRAGFHEFSLGFHPDAYPGADEETRARLTRIFQRGVEAYRVLSVPERRAAYDLALAKGELRLEGGASTRVDTGARSLDEVCRSPGAKLYAKRAEELIASGELEKATSELYRALRAEEGENPELLERIHAVTALTRLGRPETGPR